MASIFRLPSRSFRTRNPIRDAATDLKRLGGVRSAITEALDSAEREQRGLSQRLETYQMRAAMLFDNGPAFGQRSQREETELAEAERQVVAATERLRQLRAHIAHLKQILVSAEIDVPEAAERIGA